MFISSCITTPDCLCLARGLPVSSTGNPLKAWRPGFVGSRSPSLPVGVARSWGQGWPEATRRAWPWPRRGRRHAGRAGAGRSCCGLRFVAGLLGELELVGDRGEHPERGVTPVVVVLLDPGRDSSASLLPGGEVLELAELELDGGVPALDDSIVESRAGPAHRLFDADAGTRGPEVLRGVLAALIGVHQHLGQGVFAAADRDGHLQGRLGEAGVVVLAHSEADDPA